MKEIISKLTFFTIIVPAQTQIHVSNSPASYIIGGIVALLILGYLIYTLMKPEKF